MSFRAFALTGLALFAGSLAHPGSLVLPATALERDAVITVVYRTERQATGTGALRVKWTDALHRVVQDLSLPVQLTDEIEIRFPLDMRLAVAMSNDLQVHLDFQGTNKKGEKDQRHEDASVHFIAKPPDRTWWDYQNIMWQDGDAGHMAALENVGVNAAKSTEHSMELPTALLSDNLRWYVENIATDFYSEYHRYRTDRPYNWSLLQAKAAYKANPSNFEGLKRHPSFSDRAWLTTIHDRLVEAAHTYSPYRPIFYNLADETGIAELAGFWDFDFSDFSLSAMRHWLKERYGSLAALNLQWGTTFSTWDTVIPKTTREAMAQTDDNFSSWADHKEWMDIAFADALKMGSDAVRSVDPEAYVGIEGAQMPGWGGYDYARISSTLQAMEPYDIGDNVEIVRSLNPKIAFVTTTFAQGPWEKHRVWFELLHGARGQIIWDEKSDIVLPDGKLGARGQDVQSYWNEIRDGIGALLIASERRSDPIAIHYSQASMRTDWMLRQRPKGDAWMDRMSWHERQNNDFLEVRDSYCRLVEDQGLQYRFVSYNQVEQGELLKHGYRVLILPWSTSLSSAEGNEIQSFVRSGGTLIVDGDAGTFDEHSRRLKTSILSELFNGKVGLGRVVHMNALSYHQQRVLGTEAATHKQMAEILAQAGVHPPFLLQDSQGQAPVGVELHEFRNGTLTLVGFHNNPQQDVDELGPPELKSNKRFEKTRTVKLTAPTESYIYDVRSGSSLGRRKELMVQVLPYEPRIFAVSPTPLPGFRVFIPQRIARGAAARITLRPEGGASPAATHVYHLEITNPSGNRVSYYSGNLLAADGSGEKDLPVAMNEAVGKWTLRAKDILSGHQETAAFEVY